MAPKPQDKQQLLTCPLDEINAFDPEILRDPHPYYDRLRKEAPVHRSPTTGLVSISTYDLIREVNAKPDIFSNDISAAFAAVGASGKVSDEEIEIRSKGWEPVKTLLNADPPVHTRYRRLVAKAFTPKRVDGMSDAITDIVDSLLRNMLPKKSCEFKTEFANRLPMYVIIDALGAPRKDFDKFRTWSDSVVAQLGGVGDHETRLKTAKDVIEMQHYFVERIEEKRANPTEDILSDLVHANLSEDDDPRNMEYGELLSIMQQLMVAGNESTANTLTLGLYELTQNPDLAKRLAQHPELIKNFVEENLRLATPATNMWRRVTADTEIGGVSIKAGEMVLLRYGSGNRDEKQFKCPHDVDIDRNNLRSHIAFGYGIHACIGLQLARKELEIAYAAILNSMTNIRLAASQKQLEYEPNIMMLSPTELNIEFDSLQAS